jgi:hypothetical protein
MTVAQDKMASVETIVAGVTDKLQAAKEACSADTVKQATNVAVLMRFNGSHSDSTGTKREVLILVGETAPTGEYDNAADGSLFIVTGAAGSGALYIMVNAAWVAVTHA